MSKASLLLTVAIFCVGLTAFATAESGTDRVQFAKSILVDQGEKAGDLVCIACSIRIRGETSGDVVAIAGSITIEPNATVGGDMVALAGHIQLDANARTGGDVVAIVGKVRRDPTATVGGDVTALTGIGWLLLIFVVPLMMLGAFITLILWLLQRSRRPAPIQGYPSPPNAQS